jgi:hypothetical protein
VFYGSNRGKRGVTVPIELPGWRATVERPMPSFAANCSRRSLPPTPGVTPRRGRRGARAPARRVTQALA